MKCTKAFTLAEVAIGLVILALLAAMVVPIYVNVTQPDPLYWVMRYEPTTPDERRAVADHVAKILAATPRTLSGHDQDWDDAIKEATKSAKETLCRPTMWECRKYGAPTGKWHYVGEPQKQ